MSNIICVDIETTGTNKKIDSIIQISAVRIVLNDDNSISYTGEEFNSYINPGLMLTGQNRQLKRQVLHLSFLCMLRVRKKY